MKTDSRCRDSSGVLCPVRSRMELTARSRVEVSVCNATVQRLHRYKASPVLLEPCQRPVPPSLGAAIEAYEGLDETREITLDLDRRGRVVLDGLRGSLHLQVDRTNATIQGSGRWHWPQFGNAGGPHTRIMAPVPGRHAFVRRHPPRPLRRHRPPRGRRHRITGTLTDRWYSHLEPGSAITTSRPSSGKVAWGRSGKPPTPSSTARSP